MEAVQVAPGRRGGRDRAVAAREAQRDEHGVGERARRGRRRGGARQAGDRRGARRGPGVLRGPRPGHARRREHARGLLRPAGAGVRRVGAAGSPGRRPDPRVLPRWWPPARVGLRHPDPRRGRRAGVARRRRGAATGDGDLAAAPVRRLGSGHAAVRRRGTHRRRAGPGHRPRRPRAARRGVRRGGRRASSTTTSPCRRGRRGRRRSSCARRSTRTSPPPTPVRGPWWPSAWRDRTSRPPGRPGRRAAERRLRSARVVSASGGRGRVGSCVHCAAASPAPRPRRRRAARPRPAAAARCVR